MSVFYCTCGRPIKSGIAPRKAVACPSCGTSIQFISSSPTESVPRFGLFVQAGPTRAGELLLLGTLGPITIGKLPDRAIILPGSKVSRSHCRLVPTGDGWHIEDKGSTNGLFVNTERVDTRSLTVGDTIRVGEYTLLLLDVSVPVRMPAAPAPPPPVPAANASEPPTCPSCGQAMPREAKICITCGIDLGTGRAILTADEGDLDRTYEQAKAAIWWVSWVSPLGIYPITSEALGTRRPYVVRAMAVATVLVTVWFWRYEWTRSARMQELKNLFLWSGNGPLVPDDLENLYHYTSYGDSAAFYSRFEELARGRRRLSASARDRLILQAHASLSPEQQCLGRFRYSQLITHAFLHGDTMHIAGNLLILLVIGSRVNALIGNLATLVFYPLLAIASGAAHMLSMRGQSPAPLLGASGVVMGLVGMYLVLMPVHKVHVAVWYRWGLARLLHLTLKMFAIRGFWVVLFFIGMDIVLTLIGSEDQVAHWAHLGGFLAGVLLGLALLVTRLVNCRGGDVLSAILGRRAWSLIGRPDSTRSSRIAAWI